MSCRRNALGCMSARVCHHVPRIGCSLTNRTFGCRYSSPRAAGKGPNFFGPSDGCGGDRRPVSAVGSRELDAERHKPQMVREGRWCAQRPKGINTCRLAIKRAGESPGGRGMLGRLAPEPRRLGAQLKY